MHKNEYAQTDVSPKNCILEENKLCDNCCECFVCDLDPAKICDNCAKCIKIPDYKTILIDDILFLEESRDKKKKTKSDKESTDR
jgi:hypothetical protein